MDGRRLLALAAACTAAALGPGRGTAAAPPDAPRLLLGDFEGWRRAGPLPEHPEGRVKLRITPAGAGRPGRALHVGFEFTAPEGGEVGVLLPLARLDARAFDQLSLWIRGDSEAGFGDALKLQFRRGDARGSGVRETGSFVVRGIGPDWQRVVVPLRRMPGIQEWKDLLSLVLVIQSRRVGVARGGYYVDDVELIATGHPGPSAADVVPEPAKRAWEVSVGGPGKVQQSLRERLAGWPQQSLVDASELPTDDRGFLWRLARDTWRGLDALTDRESGLPVDNVHLTLGSGSPEVDRIGDFTNVTNIGLRLMAIAAARDLGLVTPAEALARVDRLLATLGRLETFRGFFYNYYDTTTLERSSSFVSFVDSAWLDAGLLVARGAFPERAEACSRLVEGGDFGFFYDPVERLMSHGYWTQLDVPAEFHYGVFYTEARLGSLLAIGKGDVPEEHWEHLVKRFPSFARTGLRVLWAKRDDRPSLRHYRGIAFAPSWGGSMFEALMPLLVLDEPALAPHSLGRNDEAHAEVQRRYALEKLGYPVWGMSPSTDPATGLYAEYGVDPLGLHGYRPGVVAPYAAALALALAPEQATENLRRLAQRYALYGEYGFYDSVDVASGAVAHAYLALDQSMLFLALAERLDGGRLHRTFEADPVVRAALRLVTDARLE